MESPSMEGASRMSQSQEIHLNGHEHVTSAAVRKA